MFSPCGWISFNTDQFSCVVPCMAARARRQQSGGDERGCSCLCWLSTCVPWPSKCLLTFTWDPNFGVQFLIFGARRKCVLLRNKWILWVSIFKFCCCSFWLNLFSWLLLPCNLGLDYEFLWRGFCICQWMILIKTRLQKLGQFRKVFLLQFDLEINITFLSSVVSMCM